MPAYKHVSAFKDRHGRERAYYRKPGCVAICLPTPVGSPEFLEAYEAAVAASPPDKPKLPPGAKWSGRRLAANIAGGMADSGVYLLLRRGRVVYVGSSANCANRIGQHKTNGRAFDKAFYIFADAGERENLERTLIRAIQPEQNKTWRFPANPSQTGHLSLEKSGRNEAGSTP